jgi:hypothetical protein
MSSNVLVYDPAAPVAETSSQKDSALGSLKGKVVGFIDNAKPNFHYLVDDLADLLVTRYGVAGVVKHRKPGQVPVGDAVLQDMTAKCDAVITGSGD